MIPYSFLSEASGVGKIIRHGLNRAADSSYLTNMATGGAIGTAAGALGGFAKNAIKDKDDPTRRNSLAAALSGAEKGAATGMGLGLVKTYAGHQIGRDEGIRKLAGLSKYGGAKKLGKKWYKAAYKQSKKAKKEAEKAARETVNNIHL